MAPTLIPREENITGASLSGSSGTANRTYTLAFTNLYGTSVIVIVDQVYFQLDQHFTISGNTLTFLPKVYDNQPITLKYDQVSSEAATVTDYGTTLELARFMAIEGVIPNPFISGADRNRENVGTGDNSTTRFFLDNAFILASSYTLYYGASEASLTALTETTHYTLDKDTGIIDLTAAGVTAVGTNNIYAIYSYCNIGLTDTQLQDAINRAKDEIDESTGNHFADGTDTTPDYNQVTDEKHDGKGRFNRAYYLKKFPLPDVSATTRQSLPVGGTTIPVDSTNGFLSSGSIGIGKNKITYTGKTTTSFTGCQSVTVAQSGSADVKPFIIEASTTDSGSSPTWTILSEGDEFELDLESGRVTLVDDVSLTSTSLDTYPPRLIPNRFRASYIWGQDTIPRDIVRLTLMMASKDLLHTAVRKAQSAGFNDFRPEQINIDEEWIKETIMSYKNYSSTNI